MSSLKIGSRLREIRISRGLTLEEVTSSVRISRVTLSNVERDLVSPNINTLGEIAKAYDMTIGELIDDPKIKELEGKLK